MTHVPFDPRPCVGFYYDGHTSARHPVTVWPAATGLTIQKEDGTSLFWPANEVHQSHGRYAGEALRLERGHPLPETVVITDPSCHGAFAILLDRQARPVIRVPHSLPRRIGVLVGATLLSIAGLTAVVLWGIPAVADVVTPFIPPSWEQALGKATVTQLVPEGQACTNARVRQETEAILAQLLTAAPHTYDFHLTIVDGKLFNAFALPGGEIVVYRPLLQATQNPEELAGVLAHEVQHVLLRHTTRALVRDMSLALLVGAAFGDLSGVTAFAIQAARTFSTLHYSRGMEEEADAQGMQLLHDAHIDPNGMIRFFETMKDRERQVHIPAYLSTHPETDQRLSTLKSMVHVSDTPARALQTEGWGETKMLCH